MSNRPTSLMTDTLFWQILSFDSHFWTVFPKSPHSGLSTSFENRKGFSLISFQGPCRWKQPNGSQSPPEELNIFLSNILVRKHISHFSGNKETSRKESPCGGGGNEQFILKLFCLELFILVFSIGRKHWISSKHEKFDRSIFICSKQLL